MKITSVEPGMPSAWASFMRTVLTLLLLGGCFSTGWGTGSWSTRPGVMPMLSELPADPAKRDAILDSSSTAAGPEQRNTAAGPERRKNMTVKERRAETAASTAAAIIGSMFSKTQNVTIGTATVFDEAALAPLPVSPPSSGSTDKPDDPARPPASIDRSDRDRVPWIKLR
jgi:hypothetical protein